MGHRHMNVEIGTEATKLQEKEYINDIFAAVYLSIRTAYGSGEGGWDYTGGSYLQKEVTLADALTKTMAS
jgi:hypothetical protein